MNSLSCRVQRVPPRSSPHPAEWPVGRVEGREAGAGCAEGLRGGVRGWRWLRGGATRRGASLALAAQRGYAEGRKAGAGCAEGLCGGARGWHRLHGGATRRGARLALAARRGYAEGREAGTGCTEGREAGTGCTKGLCGGARGWRWLRGGATRRGARLAGAMQRLASRQFVHHSSNCRQVGAVRGTIQIPPSNVRCQLRQKKRTRVRGRASPTTPMAPTGRSARLARRLPAQSPLNSDQRFAVEGQPMGTPKLGLCRRVLPRAMPRMRPCRVQSSG